MKNDALFCVGQKAFIEKDGKVLVLNDPIEGLDFPGGKIQEGEAKDGEASSLLEPLKREVREETGLEIEVSDPFHVWYHEFPKTSRNLYLIAFKCKYISGEVKLSEEHNKYQWVDKNNYQKVDDSSDYFDVLEKYFKPQETSEQDFDEWNKKKKELSDRDRVYFQKGEIWITSIGKNIGDEEDGKHSDFERPVLVVRKFNNNIFLGVPLTSNESKNGKYYHKLVSFSGSTLILSQARLFDAKRLLRFMSKIDNDELKEIKLKIGDIV